MTARWTERELRRLQELSTTGVSAYQIAEQYNATRGCRYRSPRAVVSRLHFYKLPYGRHSPRWSVDEKRLIQSMGGKFPIQQIKQALLEECGTARSIFAVAHQLEAQGFPWSHDESHWISTGRAAYFLGLAPSCVIRMCENGELQTERFGGGAHSKRFIKPAWIDDLIDRQPPRFEPAAMPPSRFRNRVELKQRECRYLTIVEAQTVSGFERRVIGRACIRGVLPALCVRRGSDMGRPRWWIKAADLARWHAQIEKREAA